MTAGPANTIDTPDHEQQPPHWKETPMSHSDLTAIVTGAASTRGIGRGTAHALAADG